MSDHELLKATCQGNAGNGERTRVLSGWKEIAAYLGRGVRTVQRWEKLGLPVRRPNAHLRSAVLTSSEELDGWVRGCGDGRLDGHAQDCEALRRTVMQLQRDNADLRREVDALKLRALGSHPTPNARDQGASSQAA